MLTALPLLIIASRLLMLNFARMPQGLFYEMRFTLLSYTLGTSRCHDTYH